MKSPSLGIVRSDGVSGSFSPSVAILPTAIQDIPASGTQHVRSGAGENDVNCRNERLL